MNEPRRPALRWHGGKWRLAPWVISHFPKHRIYVEPYGGAASVLLRKQRCFSEVYNDLDGEVVNLFRVLRDERRALQLVAALEMTPFARQEFQDAYEPCDDDIERARRLVARSFMAFGTTGRRVNQTGFRAKAYRQNQTGALDFVNHPSALLEIAERFRGVVIECRPALDVMTHQDGPETLHYVDPPYLPATRSAWRGENNDRCYAVEMSVADHEVMLDALCDLEGMVVLSGYPSPLYDAALDGWRRVEREALADGAVRRTECLWLNPAAMAGASQPLLLQEAGHE